MTSFFSLNSVLPRANQSNRRDDDNYASQQDSSNPAQANPQGTSKKRSAYAANDEGTIPATQPSPAQFVTGRQRNGSMLAGSQSFDLARSPPSGASNKNTKHVPCKFFRQGACQAGNACPFSHSLDPSTQTQPCKYFMKGTCKFGAKCALAHVYPDGSLANRPNRSVSGGGANGSYSNGARLGPPPYHNPDLALSNSILTHQQQYPEVYPPQFPYPDTDDPDTFHDRYSQFPSGIPTIEGGFASPPGSHFGSPPEEPLFPKSPVEHFRTALNAPMPQSFDSNGVSHIAKYGPLGHSVPDKFGMKSPPGSLPKKLAPPLDAVTNLKASAFASNSGLRNTSSLLGTSPQAPPDILSGQQRLMHSSMRPPRTRVLSSSVPQNGPLDDWDDSFNFDADLLPNSVRDEVLTPQEKMRRMSKADSDINMGTKDMSNGLAIPSGNSSKVGSPNMASSPSRYRAIFEQQQQQKKEQEGSLNNGTAIGHVGSPLRESWLPNGSSGGPGMSTSPRNGPLSGMSQQMARLQLSRTESNESTGTSGAKLQPPSIIRNSSGRFERGISSPGISSMRIDEEAEGLVFSMDEDASKKSSLNFWARSPRLGPVSNDVSMPRTKPMPIDVKVSPSGTRSPW